MKSRLTAAFLTALLAGALCVAAAGASVVGIYTNGMETAAKREEMVKLSGRNCKSTGAERALLITLGRHTSQCSYRTPVLGRDLEVAASESLLSETPKSLQRRAFTGLFLRTGGGGGYQLLLYPLQQKVQLLRYAPGGKVRYLAIARSLGGVGGLNKANEIGLQAIDVSRGPARGQCQLFAFLNGKPVAEAIDPAPRELSGSASGVAIGSTNNATGTSASVGNVIVRVPSPF